MDRDTEIIAVILGILLVAMVGGALYFDYQKQHNPAQPQSKYMMDDYGNIYSIQPCKDCKNCIQLEQIDTAEIKVKAFDFVPR